MFAVLLFLEVTVLPGHELLRVPSGLNLKTSVARGSFIDPSLESCGTNAFSKGHLWKAPGRVCREGRYRKVNVLLVLCRRSRDGKGLGRGRRLPGFCESCPTRSTVESSIRRLALWPGASGLSHPACTVQVKLLWDGEKYVGEYRSNMAMSGSLVLKSVS